MNIVTGEDVKRVSSQVNLLRQLAIAYEIEWKEEASFAFARAADTIESLFEKLQAASMERSAIRLDNGWIYCDERLPSTMEYMEIEPAPHMKRLEIAYVTDTIEYLIGFHDGSRWMNKHHDIIAKVIAWKPFMELQGVDMEAAGNEID